MHTETRCIINYTRVSKIRISRTTSCRPQIELHRDFRWMACYFFNPSIFNSRSVFRLCQFANLWNSFTNTCVMRVENIDSRFFIYEYLQNDFLRCVFINMYISYAHCDNIKNIQLHLHWCNITVISNREVNSVKTITWAFGRKTQHKFLAEYKYFKCFDFFLNFITSFESRDYKIAFFSFALIDIDWRQENLFYFREFAIKFRI